MTKVEVLVVKQQKKISDKKLMQTLTCKLFLISYAKPVKARRVEISKPPKPRELDESK